VIQAAALEIRDLRVEYSAGGGLLRRPTPVRVLDGIDLIVKERETLGLVGESGSGKTTLLLSVLRLIPAASGQVRIAGEDVLTAPRDRLRWLRRRMQVVFQNPHSSLDPHLPVHELVAEPLRIHTRMTRPERLGRVTNLLDDVGLPSTFAKAFPHELSGGQAQRVAIARALALSPTLLLLDEPTSSLDVSVQAQVLNLLVDLQQELGLTYVFVSHDLSVVQHISDRIAVLHLGQIIELGPTERIFQSPEHPYTQALLAASLPAETSGAARHLRTKPRDRKGLPSDHARPGSQ